MTVVVKIGGTAGVDREKALDDVAAAVERGEDVVVVHGGSSRVDSVSERLGLEPRYVESPGGVESRFTDEEAMEAFSMAMQQLNIELVEALQSHGVDAVGLSGVDGRLLEGERKDKVIAVEDGRKKVLRGDHSGKIQEVNSELLTLLLDADYTPVVGVPMLAYEDTAVNADADRAAAAVAGALEADLQLLTDVPGLLEDPYDPDTLIQEVTYDDIDEALETYAEGRMKKKVLAAREALAGGAASATIASANVEEPLSDALEGRGTVFTR